MISTSRLGPWEPLRQQAAFRALMNAFSYPGRVSAIHGAGGGALVAALAALLDASVTLADPDGQLDAGLLPLFEARLLPAPQAAFVVARGDRAPCFAPALGTLGSPEHAATVLVTVAALGEGDALRLSGPGCDGHVKLQVHGLHPAWLDARAAWNANFPMGVDMILVDSTQLAALPRTTTVSIGMSGDEETGGRAWAT